MTKGAPHIIAKLITNEHIFQAIEQEVSFHPLRATREVYLGADRVPL